MINGSLKYQPNIPGQLTDKESLAIALVATHLPPGSSMVEVGSLFGRSSWLWASNAPKDTIIYCIDPWERNSGIARLERQYNVSFGLRAFLRFTEEHENIVALKGYSPDDFSYWTRPIYLYFEDAVHEGSILFRNLSFWSSHVVADGIICGHDFQEKFPDVCYGACQLARSRKGRLQLFDSFWCITGQNNVDLFGQLQELGAVEIDCNKLLASAPFLGKQRISRTDVIHAYKYLLGRYPESEEVIAEAQRNCKSLEELRHSILASSEFSKLYAHIRERLG